MNPFFKCSPYNYKFILSRFVEVFAIGVDVMSVILQFLAGSELFGPVSAKLPEQCVVCGMNHDHANKCIKMSQRMNPLFERNKCHYVHRYFDVPVLQDLNEKFAAKHPLTYRAFGSQLFRFNTIRYDHGTEQWNIANICFAVLGGNLDHPMSASSVFEKSGLPCLGIFNNSTSMWNEAVNESSKQLVDWFISWLYRLCSYYKDAPLQMAFDDLMSPVPIMRAQSVRALNLDAFNHFKIRYRSINCANTLKKYIELVWGVGFGYVSE